MINMVNEDKLENKPIDFYDDTEIKTSFDKCDFCEHDSTHVVYKDGDINNRVRSNLLPLCDMCFNSIKKHLEMTVFKDISVEVAHRLPGHISCGVLHGHTINITVGVRGTYDFITGMVIDFNELKVVLHDVIESKFDHSYLNNFFYMPTSETLSIYIYNSLRRRGYNVDLVRVHETQKNYVEFGG